VQYRIVDASGVELAQGQHGEIQVGGQILMSGIFVCQSPAAVRTPAS
jgi:hypothetical protein